MLMSICVAAEAAAAIETASPIKSRFPRTQAFQLRARETAFKIKMEIKDFN
jgi:hypothetical protein